jgi:lipooligosaccharide transport system ATP-binding protein
MEEAEKLCKRLIIMAQGKVVAEGIPGELISKNVKRYALEIREADSAPLLETNKNILSSKRGSTHFYFAENPDELTPLIDSYGTRTVLLRPSNLEDVFLNLIKN